VVLKVIMGINLVQYAAHRRAGMEEREKEDAVNDFGRDPIGEGLDERVSVKVTARILERLMVRPKQYNRDLKVLLDDHRDDATPAAEMGEKKVADPARGPGGGGGGGKKKRVKLEDITRFTMVKRIW
jgi:hypothetical protein